LQSGSLVVLSDHGFHGLVDHNPESGRAIPYRAGTPIFQQIGKAVTRKVHRHRLKGVRVAKIAPVGGSRGWLAMILGQPRV
jgi:hypothetical protein